MKKRIVSGLHFLHYLLPLVTPWPKSNGDGNQIHRVSLLQISHRLTHLLSSSVSKHNGLPDKSLWKGSIPKNIQYFYGRLAIRSLIKQEVLIKKVPSMVSALSWCVLHLAFSCIYSTILEEDIILPQISYGLPNDPLVLLNMLLIGHPFKNYKPICGPSSSKAFFAHFE